MAKKKSFLGKLFGGKSGSCNCGIEVMKEQKPQKSGCCNMQIIEQPEKTERCCGNTDDEPEDK